MHHKRLKAATLIYPLLGMVLTLISMSPAQAQSELTEQLKALVEAGQAEQAYELATDALFNNEGKPGFDYYYGVAAIDAGKVDEGIFALERLLVANPDNHRVRLELARGYYLLGQYERAKSEFNTVLAIDPPQQVRENVVRYLDAIDQRESAYKTKLSGFVQLSTGWDGNVNSAPGDPSFTTPTLGSGTLGAGSVSDGDRFMSLTGGASISHPLTQQWSLLGNVQRSDLILEKNRDFETTAMDVGGSAVWQSGDYSARLNLGFQDYSLGHERYRDASSIG
ncbi:MAG: tetratricopeptide repeat protein, partial [Gammaproteobacteria bacterium]